MDKVYFIIDNNNCIVGYTDTKTEGTIEIEINDDNRFILNPDVFNHYFLKEDKQFVKMTEEEFDKYRPFYLRPKISDTETLQLQKNVITRRVNTLEECIMELSNTIYGTLPVTPMTRATRSAVNIEQYDSSNTRIIGLYIDKLIMNEIIFKDIPNGLKDNVETELINMGLGYLSIKDTYIEE